MLGQLEHGRSNEVVWVKVVSQFMQPLVHCYGKDVHPETTNIEKYCPVAGEALLFLLLENNYDRWVAEYERKDNSKEEWQKMAALPASKFSGCMQGNGRTCGG